MISVEEVLIVETKPTPATVLFCIYRVSFAHLPCVIISIFPIQVYAMSTLGDGGLHGTHMPGLNQGGTGKKRQRSVKWSEAETIRLLECLRVRVQKRERGEQCAKGSAKWEEIAKELQDSNFEFRLGKHVAEKWDTLRRVYLCVEEHLRYDGDFSRALRESREAFKLVPAEYTQRWHDLAAVCIPTQKENPNKKHKNNGAQPSLKNIAVHQDPTDLNPASVVQLSGIALACDKLIRSVDLKLFPAAKSSPCDEREEPDNIVTALHSLVTAIKTQAKFVSSDSYLLEIGKREWKLVEDLASSLSEKHHCSPLPRPRNIDHVHEEPVGGNPPDWANAAEGKFVSGGQEAIDVEKEILQPLSNRTKMAVQPIDSGFDACFNYDFMHMDFKESEEEPSSNDARFYDFMHMCGKECKEIRPSSFSNAKFFNCGFMHMDFKESKELPSSYDPPVTYDFMHMCFEECEEIGPSSYDNDNCFIGRVPLF